jgi:hypothetical protein
MCVTFPERVDSWGAGDKIIILTFCIFCYLLSLSLKECTSKYFEESIFLNFDQVFVKI